MARFCLTCTGSGIVMGSGMQVKDCPSCDGSGDFIDIDSKAPVTTTTPVTLAAIGIDKRSKGYKQAIDKIMALDSSLTRDDACKIFADEYAGL